MIDFFHSPSNSSIQNHLADYGFMICDSVMKMEAILSTETLVTTHASQNVTVQKTTIYTFAALRISKLFCYSL